MPNCRFLPSCSNALQRQLPGAAAAVPAAERVPCNLLAWGAAQRAPIAASLRSGTGVQEDCWQHRNAPGLAPGAAHIDAALAAVGRKHAAVVTATGACYTWGEGRGGKLGLGHDQVGILRLEWVLAAHGCRGRWSAAQLQRWAAAAC